MTTRHVVHVVRSDSFSGVERYVVDTATELRRRGWTVTVIGGDTRRMRAGLPDDVTHYSATTVVDVARALWPLRGCDIVHAHMTAAELPAAVLKRRVGGRLFVTRHFAAARGRSLPGRFVSGVIRARVDEQIAISQFVADTIGEPSTVIHNGVPSSDLSLPREHTVLVMQRLEQEKDTETAVRAWAVSGLGRAGWRLLVHGRGSEERALRLLAAELGVGESVEFGGFTDEPRRALARAAMLLATASAEPFGLVVVESMAEATPVIATHSGAHQETLKADGRYFAPGDVERCADALRALSTDPVLRVRLGESLRNHQRSEFSVGVHVDRLEAAYLTADVLR